MALTADRNTAEMIGEMNEYPVLAATRIFTGSLVVADASGWAMPGATATGLKALGRAEKGVDNSAGANGDLAVKVKRGVFRFRNGEGADEIDQADIGNNAYIVDDETVASVSTSRSIAGRIMGLDDLGVWVAVGFGVLNAPGGTLLAANNLSDVGTAATALTNLGGAPGLGTPTFVIGSETTGVRTVSIQLKTVAGADLAVRGAVAAYLSADANGDAITGLDIASVAAGTDGLLSGAEDGVFHLVSEADGDIDVVIDSNANGTVHLVLIMPHGRLVASGAITFAAAE